MTPQPSPGVRTVTVRGVELGSGVPAVVVPLTGTDQAALLAQAAEVAQARPDLVEWRADLVPGLVSEPDRLVAVGRAVVEALGGLPLLLTIRTRAEGGAAEHDPVRHLAAVQAVLGAGLADLLDVEVLADPEAAAVAVAAAHGAGVPVIGSHHDWQGTPPPDALAALLGRLADSGADVLKLAVTPGSPQDVAALLAATAEATGPGGLGRPVIAVAMGDLGVVTRLAGGVFGSAATFAAVGEGSAPGQLDLDTVRGVLSVLHGPRPGADGAPRAGRHA